MKKFLFLFSVIAFFTLTACAGSMQSLSDDKIAADVQGAGLEPHYVRLDRAQQSVGLALEYHDQGGFEKSADLFIEAADLFDDLDLKDEERRALIAAAKMQLKCSKMKTFLLTMAKYKGLLDRYEMPPEEERFLINLSDHLKSNPLTYPLKSEWKVVFNN